VPVEKPRKKPASGAPSSSADASSSQEAAPRGTPRAAPAAASHTPFTAPQPTAPRRAPFASPAAAAFVDTVEHDRFAHAQKEHVRANWSSPARSKMLALLDQLGGEIEAEIPEQRPAGALSPGAAQLARLFLNSGGASARGRAILGAIDNNNDRRWSMR